MDNIAPGPFRAEGVSIKAFDHGQLYTIARCDGKRLTVESREAHARLFAASLRMLDALEAAEGIMSSLDDHDMLNEACRATLQYMRTTIAAAKGE